MACADICVVDNNMVYTTWVQSPIASYYVACADICVVDNNMAPPIATWIQSPIATLDMACADICCSGQQHGIATWI